MMSNQSRYPETYARWRADPEGFWRDAAREIDWTKPADKVFDPDWGIFGGWFVGAQCNACYNAVDRHVERGRADQAALIYDSPVTGTKRTYTYAQLQDEIARLAAVLQDLGVEKGDRVVLYMPMIPQALFGMLACARIGAVHSVVFGGFAASELATRLEDATPKVILTASCGIETARVVPYKPLLDEAIGLSRHKPAACLIFQRPQYRASVIEGRDHDWAEKVAHVGRRAPCVPVAATDPLYILYTSGTTGRPKGVVRDTGGYLVALKWTMGNIYGVAPGEVYWCASDVGWVVGHSYIVYGPLLHGCTTVLYEGKPVGTPDAGAFWRVVAEHKAVVLFTAPTAFRAIKKEDPDGRLLAEHDLTGFRALFLAGERADPDTVQWAERILGVPIVDHWWQTKPAGPSPQTRSGLERCRSNTARRRCRCPATTFKRWTKEGGLCRPTSWAPSPSSCPCRPAACRRSGKRTSASARRTSPPIRAITTRRMRASSMPTATFTSWAAPTTSSTWRATGCPRAAWRRCWPPTRPSPNAR